MKWDGTETSHSLEIAISAYLKAKRRGQNQGRQVRSPQGYDREDRRVVNSGYGRWRKDALRQTRLGCVSLDGFHAAIIV